MSIKGGTSRRNFLAATLAAAPALSGVATDLGEPSTMEAQTNSGPTHGSSTLLPVDYQKLVSRADLHYESPARRGDEGMPIGNGRMGSLVWTTPSTLRFQINRPDVFAENCETNSFPERHTDYSAGCGYVDIDFVNFGDDVFAGRQFSQHLSVYDALMTVEGNGVSARVLAWHSRDVMAVEVSDSRERSIPVNIDLRMLRYLTRYTENADGTLGSRHISEVVTRSESAASQLGIRDGQITLTQKFREDQYYNSSAVVIRIVGREAKATYVNESTVRVSPSPGRGTFTILISSAASFDPNQDAAGLAIAELDTASSNNFESLLTSNRTWWHDFWSKAFVSLHSPDGVADDIERNATYFLYVMAASSRAVYQPRFGGMLWFTNGDMREWGSQHWWHNSGCYYNGLCPTNRFEIMNPMFSMYSKMHDNCALAARQQWGSQGIYIPETCFFDGLENLPDDIAAEMRELYLMRKPWDQRSARFMEYAEPKQPHTSRWDWKGKGNWVKGEWKWKDKGEGPYGETSHILSSGAKIAFIYWLRYEYTRDQNWLRDRAYPMLKGISEFYRNFPNLKKGEDGKYHIHYVNNHEPVRGARDTMEELCAMRGILPLAIRSSEILTVDDQLRSAWQELLDNLAPLPTNEMPDTLSPRQPGESVHWVAGLKPYVGGNITRVTDHVALPASHYDLCTTLTDDAEMIKMANATFDAMYPQGINSGTSMGVLSLAGVAAAYLGRANDVRWLIPNQMHLVRNAPPRPGHENSGVMRNRMAVGEGPGNVVAEHLGRGCQALHVALLQDSPPSPGREPILHVFPAWPTEWDAQYTLLARGAFLVTSSIRSGQVEFVELLSQVGGECRLKNPWPQSQVTLYRNGKKSEALKGPLLTFSTQKDETIAVTRDGASLGHYQSLLSL